MKKQITIMLGIILALPMIFAMIAGTNETIEFSDVVSECYIYNNQSDLIGLNLTEEGSKVIISTDVRYKSDTFIVSCLVRGSREEAQESSGGGGYYTYPWRNKVNETTNKTETIIPITSEEDEETIATEETEEVIVEESKSIKGWMIGLGIVMLICIIILIVIKKNKPGEIESEIVESNLE